MTPAWVEALAVSPWMLLALTLLVAADGLFPPIPSEAVLTALGAFAVTTDPARLAAIVPAAAIGSFAGDLAAYLLGGRINVDSARLFTGARARRLLAWAKPAFDRRAMTFLLSARFLPGGRTVTCVAAGMLRFPLRRFAPITALASLAWACYMTGLGIVAARWLSPNPLVAAVIGITLGLELGVAFDRLARRRAPRP